MAGALRIVFFGTARFAVPALQELTSFPDRFEVVAVVSQPDKPAGRQAELRSSPVATAAKRLGLRLLQPEKLKDPAFQETVRGFLADIFVVAAYGKIVPKALLEMPRIAAVNIHGSLLPKYRGASPIQAAILAGERETGVSLMVMDEQVDHGPLIASAPMPIAPGETHESLEEKLGELGADLLLEYLSDFAAGILQAVPQTHENATFTKILERRDGFVRWDQEDAGQVERKVRAFSPWPGAFAVWERRGRTTQLKLLKARVSDPDASDDAPPGMVRRRDGSLEIKAKNGWLELLEVQPEGKKPMSAPAFLNGYKDADGAVFSSSMAAP
jgi:methionyl-tRNA formyltransferase